MDENADVTEIYLIVRQCKEVFADCVATPALGEPAWIRSAQGDFNLWCAGIKAASTDKSSLDYRLRAKPDVREAICDLLRGLVVALQKCQQLIMPKPAVDVGLVDAGEDPRAGYIYPDKSQGLVSWEAMSNESSSMGSVSGDEASDPFLSEYISYIKTILGQLLRISLAIRKSGNKYRFEKADNELKEASFKELRLHLTTIILMAFEDLEAQNLTVVKKMQRASDYGRLTSVQRRMVHANILRRNRIVFATRSRNPKGRPNPEAEKPKPVVVAGKVTAPELPAVQASTGPSQPTSSINTSPLTQSIPEELTPLKAVTVAATATEVGSKLDIKHLLAKRTSSVATKMTKIGASITYPRCPNLGLDGALICPYCDDILPSEYSLSKWKDSWKAHVVQDIVPYSCIVDDCETPTEMYLTAESLLAHMLEKHSVARWTCDYCAYGENKSKESHDEGPEQFDTARKWESHIATKHGDTVPVGQRAILAELNKRLMIGPLSCPLCEFTTESMDTKIDNHILQHMHEFSLRALPEGAQLGDDKESTPSQASGLLSHTQLNTTDVSSAREYPAITLQEVQEAMGNVWHLLQTNGNVVLQNELKQPLQSDTIKTELWQARARRLQEIIATLKFVFEDNILLGRPSQLDVAVEALQDMNSIAIANVEPPQIKQTDSAQYISVPSRPPHSTGYDDILDTLEDVLFYSNQEPSQQSRVALIGRTGIEKTSIVCTLVQRMREHSEDCSVFWVDASTEATTEQSYIAILDEFGHLSGWTGSIWERVQSFLRHLTWTFNGHWLVVLDGLKHQTAQFLSFKNLLPQGLKGSLLITASDPTCLALLGPVKTIPIPELDDETDENNNCLRDLMSTDPRDDKQRIELNKDDMAPNLYQSVLDSSDFRKWCADPENRLLWVKGGPGTGKTMLLCSIVDKMKNLTSHRDFLSFFICKFFDPRLNNATSVIRGLIYLLLVQQPSLISHVREKYDHAGKRLFEDVNALFVLSDIFTNILQDPTLKSAYLVIDALDECVVDLPYLLEFIGESLSLSTHVKWLLSSRNRPDLEPKLDLEDERMMLRLDLEGFTGVSRALEVYIDSKLSRLESLHGKDQFRKLVRENLLRKSGGIFLWCTLVLEKLENVDTWEVYEMVKEMPKGIEQLYDLMLDQIEQLPRRKSEFCWLILSTATVAYRPLHLDEIAALSGLPNEINVREIVAMCGSFLRVRDDRIDLPHLSVRDYFMSGRVSGRLFPFEPSKTHHRIFSRSLQLMSKSLRRDMYNLRHPGFPIDEVKLPDPDPLASIRYSCIYWVDHLRNSDVGESMKKNDDLQENGVVHRFIQEYYLYWLEALSLLQSMSKGVLAMENLENVLRYAERRLTALVRDARRFIQNYGECIGNAPLQVYVSALLFSPARSIISQLFKAEKPEWVEMKPIVESDRNACLLTLENHTHSIYSVAFSPDGHTLASASRDETIKLWDATTGECLQTLEGHDDSIYSVAVSPDGHTLASASSDGTIKLWDIATGECLQTLEGHVDSVESVAFSLDSQVLASASDDNTIRLWDIATGLCLQTLKGHVDSVESVAFSPDDHTLASGSSDNTIKLWDATTGECLQTLKGHVDSVESVAFSPDDHTLASGSSDNTIKLWDATTGECLQTLEGHDDSIYSVAVSPDGHTLASASSDGTIKLWDIATGLCLQTLKAHIDSIYSVTFSPDGHTLASASSDGTMKLWNSAIDTGLQTLEGHSDYINLVTFSPEGKLLASASRDSTIKLWNAATGACLQTLEGHSDSINSVTFSPDSQVLTSASDDMTIRLWNAARGACLQTLVGHSSSISSVAFSSDSRVLASASDDKTIRLWDIATGLCLQTLEGHSDFINSVAFSPDSQVLASASDDMTIKLWDTARGACLQTLVGHSSSINSVAFSSDSQVLASASDDMTIRLWDTARGACLQTLVGHSDSINSVAFSPDSQILASASDDMTIRIWDLETGSYLGRADAGKSLHRIIFNPTGADVITEIGAFTLDLLPTPNLTPSALAYQEPLLDRRGFGLSLNSRWIVRNAENLVWLPPQYRALCSAISGSTVAFGCASGRVLIMRFSTEY